jgi:PASTA domain
VTATVPPSASAASVSVTVTTLAGSAKSAGFFKYVVTQAELETEHKLVVDRAACVVPKLRGRRPVAAKKAVKNAGCAAGKVRRKRAVKAMRGKVIRQSPAAGKVVAPGTKVSLTVGR